MQRLSSRSTYFFKRVFPAFWFGFLALWTVVWAGSALVTHDMKMLAILPGPLIMALFGYALFKWLLFGLVDEVWLEGDHLLVRNKGEQSRVALANVINVNASVMISPPRITLSLRQESPVLGKDISFMPIGRTSLLAAFKPSPIASELIQRIDTLRHRRPA